MYKIPDAIFETIRTHFSDCNTKLAHSLSQFPGIREEALDAGFIAYFQTRPGPFQVMTNWTIRYEAHYIGGARHYGVWEVADIGLMVIFRRNGKIVRSKLAFIQSKKLYPKNVRLIQRDPYHRQGMGRLLETDEEHQEVVKRKEIVFDEQSKYKAFRKNSEQQVAMSSFQERFDINMYYLFYNPLTVPHQIITPIEAEIPALENVIGCRILTKDYLDEALSNYQSNYQPSYGDIKYLLPKPFTDDSHLGGWRLEYFVSDLVLGCKEGFIDDSPNFKTLMHLLEAKSSPISAAISITIDYEDKPG
jgi:hypothetical protein